MLFRHPKDVCMTYVEHMKFAMNVSFRLFVGSAQSFIHAIIPDMFVDSTSNLINTIDYMLKNSGCRE
tara:strand:- start:9168 stop:9368 length:201 start_codon:yes stop_codon:yes gene_type:complete